MPWTAPAVVALALVFGFFNGALDSGSLVATAIASRSLTPRRALALASAAELAGPFLFGTAVAATIGSGMIRPEAAEPVLVVAALAGAIGWNLVALSLGLPTSSTHALVGGLVGAALAGPGIGALMPSGLLLVLAFLVLGPTLGLLAGYIGLRVVLSAVRGAAPSINIGFRRGQVVTLVVLALSHGTNDGQKIMGVIALGLVAAGVLPSFSVPLWVVAASAGALALGVALGGSRIIRTLGAGLYRVRPVHGFSAQASAGLFILAATALGGPVSTGQVVSAAILGVGAAHRLSAVRWSVAANIITAWLVTMPVSALASGGIYWLLTRL